MSQTTDLLDTASAEPADVVPPTTVGIVGVGAMGLPMALRMHAAGLAVRAVDVSAERVARCRAHGLRADTDLGVLAGVDVLIAMVATGAQLSELLRTDLVTEGELSGATLVVASTVGPEALRAAAEVAATHGLHIVDAPVTGGVAGATAGTLTLFTAGAPAVVGRLAPVLAPLGSAQLVGEHPGDGQSLKLVNQMLAGLHLAAAGEALAFAERLGLDLDTVTRLLPAGAAASWMLADRGPRMAMPREKRPAETQLSVFVKDSGLVDDAAADAGAHAPLTRTARQIWLRAAELGLGDGDDAGVVEVFRA